MNHHDDHITDVGARFIEAQGYQSIGALTSAAEDALTHQKAWDGLAGSPPSPEAPIDQLQAHDISFWNRRANRQALAVTDDSTYAEDFFRPQNAPADIPPTAGYSLDQGFHQTPTAATHPDPFNQFDPGVIPGASAARERSGNQGVL